MNRYLNLSLEDIIEIIDGVTYVEEWRDIKNFEGVFKVSSFGRIKCVSIKCERGNYGKLGIFKQTLTRKKYLAISFRHQTQLIHRIVAKAFIENPFNKQTINHIDTIKINNFYKNLEWNTNLENLHHAIENKLHRKNHKRNDIIVYDLDKIISLKKTTGISNRQIAKEYKVTHSTISNLIEKRKNNII